MDRNWYEWLRNEIDNTKFYSNTDCAFMNGYINSAFVAGFITKEQRDELSDMFPDY